MSPRASFDWRKEYEKQHGPLPGTVKESRAKADVEVEAGPATLAPRAIEERLVQTAKMESVSRPAAGRSAAATSELMDVTSRERPAPNPDPDILRWADDGGSSPDMVEVAPHRTVNAAVLRRLEMDGPR